MLKTRVDRIFFLVSFILVFATFGSFLSSALLHTFFVSPGEVEVFYWLHNLSLALMNAELSIAAIILFVTVLINFISTFILYVIFRVIYKWVRLGV